VTFRPLRTRVTLLSMGVLLVTVSTVVAVHLPRDGGRRWSTGERFSMVAAAVVILAVLTLLSRPRVTADRDGVTIVNLVTRRRLAWAQLVRVGLAPGDPWVHLDLADGTTLAAMGIQPASGRAAALRDARLLRALAEEYGTAASDR
jgi:hypothetical protein